MQHALRLSPGGQLRWESLLDDAKQLTPLQVQFADDWRIGLFALSAEKLSVDEYPTLLFWQELSNHFLTALCHIPGEGINVAVPLPADSELQTIVFHAPPMTGGEYLSPGMLGRIWKSLERWVCDRAELEGGLAAFLHAHAPAWHKVGRVCFQLAENADDLARPFGFMATYTPGFNAAGNLKHLPLQSAAEQFSRPEDGAALAKLLGPVHEAAKRCPWIGELIESGDLYKPVAWTTPQAYRLLRDAELLEESGLALRLPDWWKRRTRPQVAVTIGDSTMNTMGASALLDFRMEVALGDERLSEEELTELLRGDDGLVLLKGQWVELDKAKLMEALAHWQAIEETVLDGEIDFIEGMRLLAGASRDLSSEVEADEDQGWVHVTAGSAMKELLAQLKSPNNLADLPVPKKLESTLRPYQRDGLSWLHLLGELGLGACLADDMGLGKTIQVLAALLCRRKEGGDALPPALLVVPASLLGNWKNESDRFTPGLRMLILHASEMDTETLDALSEGNEERFSGIDVVMTTYGMINRLEWLHPLRWDVLILDEAQAIKNPGTRQSKTIKKLNARARVALTGTPIENRLGDLWSLFDFLNPGLLGSPTVFKRFLKGLRAREHDHYAPLRRLVSPYILRRLKTDRRIIADLPDKTETTRFCTLSRAQVRLYQKTVKTMTRALEQADGIKRRGLVLQTLMRLKQICNHPSQLNGDGVYKATHSGKFQRLAEICEELAERQERVLIFTQFREIIPALEDHLARVFGNRGLALHGGTPVGMRRKLVDRFQEENGPPYFILSIKAGGTGLNLTAASHVIHFDRWWNPAVENQATDRAFRIGQQKNVLVHKFVTLGTIEERIDALIEEKRSLSEEILNNEGEINVTELPDDELLGLIRLDINRATD
jgi:superfamily II DNA or RNA helicase